LYITSILENTDFAIEFSCFELDNADACQSMMIYPTDSRSELNEHPSHIICRTEAIQNRPEIVQALHRPLDLPVQGAQVLHLDLSRQSTC